MVLTADYAPGGIFSKSKFPCPGVPSAGQDTLFIAVSDSLTALIRYHAGAIL